MNSEAEIDDSFYSRQRYMLGDSAMKRLAESSVLVYGLGGLGVEIAKNLALAGVKLLTVQDWKICAMSDLGTQFFIRHEDVVAKKSRVEASAGRLAELNPHVSVSTVTEQLTSTTNLDYLLQYQCVILTECPQLLQVKVDNFCRTQPSPIRFICCDVYGVFGCTFCDFGENFYVCDPTGEDPEEVFIGNVTKANPGVVTCLENYVHGLQTEDVVIFKEVQGMDLLNMRQFHVKVLSPTSFSIDNTSGDEFGKYLCGGMLKKVKLPVNVKFNSLSEEITSPTFLYPDLGKLNSSENVHLAFRALHAYIAETGYLPELWCNSAADCMLELAEEVNKSRLKNQLKLVDEKTVRCLAFTSRGCLAPLCAAVGGFAAQECLKALTGKFRPLTGWLYLETMDILPNSGAKEQHLLQTKNDSNYSLRACLGEDTVSKLAETRLFMVGCGAIGCEMLKNFALLGIGSGSNGKITITDNDIIEKSNLNRQFLFHSRHIQKPKSTTACQSVLDINPDLNIVAQQQKVCADTEQSHYPDSFYESQDVVVNALDNVESRRYVDSRCVTNLRPLLDSGTMAAKGHVQVIVPYVTETYASQQDPTEETYPYCMVKSFPSTMAHCIQWARDKFEQICVVQPCLLNKFMASHADVGSVADRLCSGNVVEGGLAVSKIVACRPYAWSGAVIRSRILFDKFFNHKALQLLHAFPLDTMLLDDSLFWQSPKRPPTPLVFNCGNPLHISFIFCVSHLLCQVSNIDTASDDKSADRLKSILADTVVPSFVPSDKAIQTDQSITRQQVQSDVSIDKVKQAGLRLAGVLLSPVSEQALQPMVSVEFEKDHDGNEHVNFMSACANLRAQVYGIENVDRLKVKQIAGRIVPAIATTTAMVSGLATIELIKVMQKRPLEVLRNTFLNLALPMLVLSEPGPCVHSKLREGLSVTVWDKWCVYGCAGFTLQHFLSTCKENFGFDVSAVVYGVKVIYMPVMPAHRKRLTQAMDALIKTGMDAAYVDLVVCFENESGHEIEGPPVRYFFNAK